MEIRRLDGAFGAEIVDVDLGAAVGDPASVRCIVEALHEHHVIVVRAQRLEPPQFARFARCLGRPQPHIKTELRHPEVPEILTLSNVFSDGKPTGIYDGAAYWHTDMSYEAEPASATLVYALQVPAKGGETHFADMAAAYDDLPAETKQRIDGLSVLHHYGNREDQREGSRTAATPLTAAQRAAVENVYHPLVRPHPVTGRKALYGVSGSSFGIVGMAEEEAFALLDSLKRHATQPRYCQAHRYQAGDVVVWDNAATLHAASLIDPATGPADTRVMHRISVKGTPPLQAS